MTREEGQEVMTIIRELLCGHEILDGFEELVEAHFNTTISEWEIQINLRSIDKAFGMIEQSDFLPLLGWIMEIAMRREYNGVDTLFDDCIFVVIENLSELDIFIVATDDFTSKWRSGVYAPINRGHNVSIEAPKSDIITLDLISLPRWDL